MRLKGRVALITGAGRGIGRAIALGYAREGAQLVLADRTDSELAETALQVDLLGSPALVVTTDVGDPGQVDEMVRRSVERFSTIDILVNNAGAGGPVGPLHGSDSSDWVRTVHVNLIGVYLCCRAVLPLMLSQRRGKIINLSGVGGRNLSAYGASKAAVVHLTESLSKELEGTDIQVNAISSGPIRTRMWYETRDAFETVGDDEPDAPEAQVSGGDPAMERAVELAVFLAGDSSGNLSVRLIYAPTDDFLNLPPLIPSIMASDTYTFRRVEPE